MPVAKILRQGRKHRNKCKWLDEFSGTSCECFVCEISLYGNRICRDNNGNEALLGTNVYELNSLKVTIQDHCAEKVKSYPLFTFFA